MRGPMFAVPKRGRADWHRRNEHTAGHDERLDGCHHFDAFEPLKTEMAGVMTPSP